MATKTNNARNKIRTLEEISNALTPMRALDKKVVLCHGVFDLLHIGHIRHFEQAKGLGECLVVTVTPDVYVNKGPGRPVFTEELRAEFVAALDCVDYVAINQWPTAVETIKLLCPDYYAKGLDYKDTDNDRSGGILREETAVRSVGGQIAFTDDITFSSSNLINRHLSVFPKQVEDYLESFTGRYSSDQVINYLEKARQLKTLVIGETIIDEYLYCQSMGKSGKEPVLAARHLGTEQFAGGIVAVANHVASVCDEVGMLTFLGQADSQEDFICEKLDPKVQRFFLYMDGESPTIVKRRFVENHPFQKLFEIYEMDDGENSPADQEALCDKLQQLLPNYDLVVVADYGHGMLGPEAVELLSSQARYLAINTQINAGNLGFNTVSKYPRADYICVSENEVRLEVRSRRRDLRDIVLAVAEDLNCERIVITKGPQGALCWSRGEGFVEVPAVASQVVDRIGAGDAVFSLTSPCALQGAPMEIIGFIGNVAGAESVATVGNRTPIMRMPLLSHIETLLK